ncbi:MAG: hypothetical protein JWR83_2413 [Aeromicrobium sp.]|nr:hypothetical protein [Aeromicrobium sp.]
MVSLLVDTDSFVEAGSRASEVARSVDRALSCAASGLSRLSHMAGSDPNGLKWAGAYDQAAGQLFGYAAQLHDAVSTVARNLRVTGYCYKVAELTNAGQTVDLVLPAPIVDASRPHVPSAAGGARKFPSTNPVNEWIAEQIANLIGDMWPDGDTGKLDEASRLWHAFADDLDDVASGLSSVKGSLDGVDIPELPRIHDAIDSVRSFAKKLATASRELGKAANTLSGKIAYVHAQTEITVGITVIAIAATVGAALGLTVFTFGISDAVGVAGVVGETAGAAATITGFIGELAATISSAVGGIVASTAGLVGISADMAATIGVAVGDVTATAVLWGYAGMAENTIVTAVTEPGSNLADAADEGFINWGAGGVLGKTFLLAGGSGAVSSEHVFASSDSHVADAANAIEKAWPGRVGSVNSMVKMSNGLSREVDVDLGDLVVQVKGGNARGLAGQIASTASSTGRTVIGYAPDMSNAAWESAARQGIPIARTSQELVAMVEEFG